MPSVVPGLVRCFAELGRARSWLGRHQRWRSLRPANFGEAEIENFCVAALGDEDVGGFDVAVDDACGVGGIERFGDLDADFEEAFEFEMGAPVMTCLSVAPSRNSMAMKARPLSSPMS